MKNEPKTQKPLSPKKQRANRKNAQKSTGPKSPEGKRRSARNAVKHGLLSRDLVLTTGDHPERPEDFRALLADLQHQFAPTNVIDHALVDRVASCLWRLARAHRFEVGAIRQHHDQSAQQQQQAQAAITDLQDQLTQQRDGLELARDQLQFLESLTDRHFAKPTDELRTELLHIAETVSPLAAALPTEGLHEFLIARLHQKSDRIEKHITRLQEEIENAQRDEELRRNRQPLLAALPAANEVLKLVRYENMLDRHLHRALNRLAPRSEPRPSGSGQTPDTAPATHSSEA